MRTWLTVAATSAVLVLGGCGDDGDHAEEDPTTPATSTSPAVVADATWCAGWQDLVAIQGSYVAAPSPDSAAAVIDVVEELEALGVPESLDPAGYTELTAVLDDVRASVDPSFTPSVAPSEPADVGEHEGHGDHDASEAPFGAWLAEYCAS